MTNETKWPQKMEMVGQENELAYQSGWNACRKQFMEVIEAQLAGLVPLDWKEIFIILHDRTHYSTESCNDVATEICLKYGATPSPKVLSVEEINIIIQKFLNENNLSIRWHDSCTAGAGRMLANEIHSKLTGEKQ